MRKLIRERPSLIGAYVLVVVTGLFATWFTQHESDQQNARLERIQKTNQSLFCATSYRRWGVQRDVILATTAPILIPVDQGVDPAISEVLAHRTDIFNEQSASRRVRLLDELGPEPPATC